MLKQNGYAQYQNAKIMTASPAELTLMLYEGAIKFGNIAIVAMENKNPAKAHENIVRVENIIQNFRDTLDKKYPIWEEFEKIYVYLLRRCHECNIAKDPEIMEEVLKHIRSMRDNWKEVMKKVASDKSNPAAQARVAGGRGNTAGYTASAGAATKLSGA
ncbi:flagellar export chaperone FliS [Lachnospiraceae bacterium MD335]|jgi:flagellar protein FliS|nr:flagellar protein FliS [Lachnospiraceae bacterium MD335]NDO48171.1 flagellar export chaperone FliS [Lachnospiraceae bacterium MD335]